MKLTEFVGIFAPLVLLGSLSCRGPATAQQILEWNQVVDGARARVMEAADLDDLSREMVRTNQPRFIVIHIPFGDDHTFEWAISSNRTVRLRAYGNYKNVSHSPVRIQTPEQHY